MLVFLIFYMKTTQAQGMCIIFLLLYLNRDLNFFEYDNWSTHAGGGRGVVLTCSDSIQIKPLVKLLKIN